jgi:long-chain acyl-CoA synthetase
MKFPRLMHEPLADRGRSDSRGRTALIVDGRSYSFAQLLDAAHRLAAALQERGVRRGDRVALYLDNSWSCVVAIYGTWIAGAVLVPLNPQTKPHKLAFILRDSGARALVTDGRLEPTCSEALRALDTPPFVICLGAPTSNPMNSSEGALPAQQLSAPASTIPLDLAAILYTSGSTGEPKGVMQTHQAMMFTCGSLIEYLRLAQDEKILCILPLSFDYGLYQLLMSVQLGACLLLERSFTFPGEIYERVRSEGVTVFPGVPTIFATLLAAHQRSPLRFPSVTHVTNTAAALPDKDVPGLREIFPHALIFRMYGLTECKRVSYLDPALIDAKPGSVGKAIPGTEVELLSPDGKPVTAGEVGILHVRGPHVMVGYWNRPDLTDQMLKPGKLRGERVLCTQDLFRMDDEGFLYFVGRTDDIIKTRGEKVSPAEVENALQRIPGVREAAVMGVPDVLLGEAICAFLVADPALTIQAIRTSCAAFLEPYAVPGRVIFCDSLPKGPTGKIDKSKLAQTLLPPDEAPATGRDGSHREGIHD